jgi:hypothetical protein
LAHGLAAAHRAIERVVAANHCGKLPGPWYPLPASDTKAHVPSVAEPAPYMSRAVPANTI